MMSHVFIVIALCSVLASLASAASSSTPSSSSGMVLRIRLADGSMEKVIVPENAAATLSIKDILEPFDVEDDATVQLGTSVIETSSTISSLSVKHGSLITIQPSLKKPTESRFSHLKVDPQSWDPFPDLAKDFDSALLKSKTKRAASKSMSYGAIAQLQSSLHVVEAQPEGPLKRVYMCRFSAERFQANGIVKKKKGQSAPTVTQPRIGLLLGTIQRERVDKTPRKARTSLSSQTSDSEYCTVAKVHAVYEPSGQKSSEDGTGNCYNVQLAQSLLTQNPRVSIIASHLGLVPVGWIFSHLEERHNNNNNEDSLPVYGLDVQMGATLQIQRMKEAGIVDGKPFVTLAMDANTGATEAFQLSDVAVQMVHEGLLQDVKKNTREVPTKHAILINGKESKTLDSVLCLVNTAMLSHEGSYAGGSATSFVKKNGSLTNEAKKSLLRCLDDDPKLLQLLCNFNTLLALDQSLSPEDIETLCGAVKKWARGQKQGTQLDSKLKLRLRSTLET